MASIPLPALDVRPPQEQDPVGQMGRLMQMRGLAQQQQLQQQALREGEYQYQATQALNRSYQGAITKDANGMPQIDPDKVVGNLTQAGFGSQVPAVMKGINEFNKSYVDLATSRTDLQNKSADMVGSAAAAVKAAGYDPKLAHTFLDALPQSPQLDAMRQKIDGDPAQFRQLIDQAIQGSPKQRELIAKETQAAAEKEKAETGEWKDISGTGTLVNVKTGETKNAGPGMMPPGMQESKYRFILQKLQQHQPVSPEDLAFAKAYEASNTKSTSTSDSLGVMTTNTSRPTGLASVGAGGKRGTGAGTGTPTNKDELVDLIGQYKANPELLGRMLYRHPEVLGMLHQKYPDFDETNYVAKNKLIQGYTSGPQSREINAINTVAGHLDTLDKAIDALNNHDTNAINRIANSLKLQAGATPQATFNTIVHRIGPEITTAYVKGGGGESERFANADDFSESKGPAQLHQNVGVTVKLLRSKIGALENQYKQTVGRDDFSQRFITPSANEAFNRLAGERGTGSGSRKSPSVGAIEQGYRFKGGDPSKPESWEKEKAQ